MSMSEYRLHRCDECGELVEERHEYWTSHPGDFAFSEAEAAPEADAFGPGWQREHGADYSEYLDGLTPVEIADLMRSLKPKAAPDP